MLNLGHFHFTGNISIFNKRINFTEWLDKMACGKEALLNWGGGRVRRKRKKNEEGGWKRASKHRPTKLR